MPGKAPREKGNRLERLAADILRSYGINAKRVPLSGSVQGFKGDLEVEINGFWLDGEAKSRATGLSKLYQWLGNFTFLVVKQDRLEPLIVMDLRRFSRLIMELKDSKTPLHKTSVEALVAFNNSHKQTLHNINPPSINPSHIPLVPKV